MDRRTGGLLKNGGQRAKGSARAGRKIRSWGRIWEWGRLGYCADLSLQHFYQGDLIGENRENFPDTKS